MKVETRLFWGLTPFFVFMTLFYGIWSGWEPVGSAGMGLLAGLNGMIAGYLQLTQRSIDARPEDDPHGEIEHGAGEQGVYPPWSWWPLILAFSAALCFLGLAVGWWVFIIGAVMSSLALVGWVFEFSRGQHAH